MLLYQHVYNIDFSPVFCRPFSFWTRINSYIIDLNKILLVVISVYALGLSCINRIIGKCILNNFALQLSNITQLYYEYYLLYQWISG